MLNIFKIIEKLSIFGSSENLILTHIKNFSFLLLKNFIKNALKKKEALIGVKKSLHRKYGFMVLPEKVVRSRIGNKRPFQNTILLA